MAMSISRATLSGSLSNALSANVSSASGTAGHQTAIATVSGVNVTHGSWIELLGRLLVFMLGVIPIILYWLVTFVSITIPTCLFNLFSTSLTFTMNFTTLMLILLAFASTVSWIVRYRYLNMYARLPPEPQRKEPQIDLFPDTQEGDSKPGLANYLDEFLSAIKVFGYLERPVFHELTRTMQTRKLIAGEILLLEEEKGFCLVVDGLVQIFVKSNRDTTSSDGTSWMSGGGQSYEDEEDHREGEQQGYQLLTEVKNGAPMSSLFSILSLFTEDVKLRHDEEEDTGLGSNSSSTGFAAGVTPDSGPTSPLKAPESPPYPTIQDSHRPSFVGEQNVPPLSLDTNMDQQRAHQHEKPQRQPRLRAEKQKSVHPDIVARATVDTTIAIIPATAFRRLTRVYPKATAHIVQVILTRLQRVTLATAHSYLGLTSEVLRTEKHMNRYTNCDLPNHLRGSALERLKDKFLREKERLESIEEGMKGIALHNPRAARRRRSSSSFRKDLAGQVRLATMRGSTNDHAASGTIDTNRRSGVSPGDLLANIQASRFGDRRVPHPSTGSEDADDQPLSFSRVEDVTSPLGRMEHSPFMSSPRRNGSQLQRQESLDEDDLFRESILTCMTKAIGLTNSKDIIRKPTDSAEPSPRLITYDARRQMATFSNAFGFMDPYEPSGDGDSESIASVSGVSAGGSVPGGISFAQELRDEIEIVYFPKGAVLVEQGERNPGLYYVIEGFLDVSIPADDKTNDINGGIATIDFSNGYGHDNILPPLTRMCSNSSRTSSVPGAAKTSSKRNQSRKSMFMIKPGGLAGYIGTISSYRSFIDVRAKTDVYVGFLPRASLERVVEKYPVVLLTMAKRLTSLLARLILHIDFALEWVQIDSGQVIYHQGDESDAIYIVLNGRLRAILEKDDGTMRVVGEYGQGESVGELEVMTESARPATLHAIRDTELAKFPKSLFNSLALEHPGITIKISKIIAQRMRALIEDPLNEQGKDKTSTATNKTVTSTLNLRTVALLPVTAGVPIVEFGNRLMSALTQIGVVNGLTSLNQAAILNHLGRHAFSRMGKLKLSQYLADLEERYGLLLYVADTNVNSPWTQTCISQADCILLVGLAEGSPSIGEYERFLLGMKTTARKELVLLHVERYSVPGLTRKWLRNRMWINGGHHHIQMAFRTNAEPVHPQIKRFSTALKQRVQVLQAEIQKYTSRRIRQTPLYSAETPFKGDFHRLARRLCGKSVGLVLGGGGARGISQVGVIRALEEAGIPIDIIGGTSIGAFIGALYARDADVVPMYGRAKKFAGRMGSMWRFALDLTYPSASYTTGHEFNRGIFKTFGNSQIEDFWLEFYCNTTNISKSRSEIHNSGYVWRYVRASMSLAGLLPPLCDEGSMLLDGGYVDNLTVAHMKSLGADVIFAIDVGSLDDNLPQAFGDSLSGFWALMNRWNPFSSHLNPPTLSEIQARLAYVSSVDALERAKTTPGCLYMRPPIDAYGTLDFAKFDEIYQVGYTFGKEFLGKLRDKGVLPVMEETEEKKNLRKTMAPRRASI
ncbi:phosphatidylcholine and lysophosphatidylcholine phospholipase [Schaereria dolodes]|nr:phosphatidylcholine and lysophosphatidylcholine phospholipase [Schaereria dolodes]